MPDFVSAMAPRSVRPTSPEPGEKPLDPVRRFLNSRLIEERIDELWTVDGATAWFVRQGYGNLRIDDPARATYRDVRESLRRAVQGDAAAVQEINRTMARYLPADPRIELSQGGLIGVMAIAETLDEQFAPLEWILASLWRGASSGELDRLKVCADDRCQIAYYDSSRNRSRAWCTSGKCGNRNRVARHRARRRATSAA